MGCDDLLIVELPELVRVKVEVITFVMASTFDTSAVFTTVRPGDNTGAMVAVA